MLDKSAVLAAHSHFIKANNSHDAAQHLLEHGFYEAVIDRAFFCMFHAARALLAYDTPFNSLADLAPDDVIENFQNNYIRQRYHDPRLGEMFEALRMTRWDEMYNCDYSAAKPETERIVYDAGYFLETAKTISERRLTLEYDAPVEVQAADEEHTLDDVQPPVEAQTADDVQPPVEAQTPVEEQTTPTAEPCQASSEQQPPEQCKSVLGRKPAATREIIAKIMDLHSEGLTYSSISDSLYYNHDVNISKYTIAKIVKGKYAPLKYN